MRFVSISRPVEGDRAVRDLRTGRILASGLTRDASIAYAVALNDHARTTTRTAARTHRHPSHRSI